MKNRKRNERIYAARLEGMTYKDIGRKFCLTGGYVREICINMKRDNRRTVNNKIEAVFKDVFAGIELEDKKFLIDPYTQYPYLRIYVTWKAYRESIKAKHEAYYSFETRNIPWMYDAKTTKREIREYIYGEAIESISRLM